jgi:hypothetical protein
VKALHERYRRSVPVTTMSSAKILHRLLAIEKQLRLVEQPKAQRISRRRRLE